MNSGGYQGLPDFLLHMCSWLLRIPTLVWSICWPVIDIIFDTFLVIQGQPFNCKSSMFKSLYTTISHLQNPENVSLHSSNSWQCNPVVVNPVMKMWPHPMAHPYWPVIVKNPPYPSGHEPTYRKTYSKFSVTQR